MINVKNKCCLENKCIRRPYFNVLDEKVPLYCIEHKKDNMINVDSKRCVEKNCIKQPIYNFATENKPIYF